MKTTHFVSIYLLLLHNPIFYKAVASICRLKDFHGKVVHRNVLDFFIVIIISCA